MHTRPRWDCAWVNRAAGASSANRTTGVPVVSTLIRDWISHRVSRWKMRTISQRGRLASVRQAASKSHLPRLLRRDCICMNLILRIGATKLREQRLTLAESCSLLKRISVSRDHRDTSSLGSYSSPPRSTWSTATRSLVIINSSSITVMVVDDDATVGWLARFDRSDVLFILLVFSCLFRWREIESERERKWDVLPWACSSWRNRTNDFKPAAVWSCCVRATESWIISGEFLRKRCLLLHVRRSL